MSDLLSKLKSEPKTFGSEAVDLHVEADPTTLTGKTTVFSGLEKLIIWICDQLHITSPYHKAKEAVKVCEFAKKAFHQNKISFEEAKVVERNLAAVCIEFEMHNYTKEASGEIFQAYQAAKDVLLGEPKKVEQEVPTPERPDFDTLAKESGCEILPRSAYGLAEKLEKIRNEYQRNELGVPQAKIELSKVGLKILVARYGERNVKKVISSANFDLIANGKKELKIETSHYKNLDNLLDTTTKKNKRVIQEAKKSFGEDIVNQIKENLSVDEKFNFVAIDSGKFKLDCEKLTDSQLAEWKNKEVQYLKGGTFTTGFVNELRDKTFFNVEERTLFDEGKIQIPREVVIDEINEGAGVLAQPEDYVEFVKKTFTPDVANHIFLRAFTLVGEKVTKEQVSGDGASKILAQMKTEDLLGEMGEGVDRPMSFEAAFKQAISEAL